MYSLKIFNNMKLCKKNFTATYCLIRVEDPQLIISDPADTDPTCQVILDPDPTFPVMITDPDPTFQISALFFKSRKWPMMLIFGKNLGPNGFLCVTNIKRIIEIRIRNCIHKRYGYGLESVLICILIDLEIRTHIRIRNHSKLIWIRNTLVHEKWGFDWPIIFYLARSHNLIRKDFEA